MKLLKKIGALVALVAVCCVMLVPVTANAESRVAPECPPHQYMRKNVKTTVTTAVHTYTVSDDIKPVVKECVVTTTVTTYDLICACGAAIYNLSETTVTHAGCGAE